MRSQRERLHTTPHPQLGLCSPVRTRGLIVTNGRPDPRVVRLLQWCHVSPVPEWNSSLCADPFKYRAAARKGTADWSLTLVRSRHHHHYSVDPSPTFLPFLPLSRCNLISRMDMKPLPPHRQLPHVQTCNNVTQNMGTWRTRLTNVPVCSP